MNTSSDIVESLFGGHGRIAILRLLARMSVALTGRQIAELADLSPAGAARALDRLASLGVISRRRVGRAVLHDLERQNLLVQTIVVPVFEAETQLLARLESDLAATFGDAALSVVLYGSFARTEGTEGGDVDVLVVTEDERGAARADEIAAEEGPRFYRTYGRPLSVISKSAAGISGGEAFVQEAVSEGRVVAGIPLDRAIRGRS